MSFLALAVDTPQTHASGSNGIQYQGQEADASSKRSAGALRRIKPPDLQRIRRPFNRQPRISLA